jgi:hypothetical protein
MKFYLALDHCGGTSPIVAYATFVNTIATVWGDTLSPQSTDSNTTLAWAKSYTAVDCLLLRETHGPRRMLSSKHDAGWNRNLIDWMHMFLLDIETLPESLHLLHSAESEGPLRNAQDYISSAQH